MEALTEELSEGVTFRLRSAGGTNTGMKRGRTEGEANAEKEVSAWQQERKLEMTPNLFLVF